MLNSMQSSQIDFKDETAVRRVIQNMTTKLDELQRANEDTVEVVSTYTNNPIQPAVEVCSPSESGIPTREEIIKIGNKLNELILALQNANILS